MELFKNNVFYNILVYAVYTLLPYSWINQEFPIGRDTYVFTHVKIYNTLAIVLVQIEPIMFDNVLVFRRVNILDELWAAVFICLAL